MFRKKTKKLKQYLSSLIVLNGSERRKAVTSPHKFTLHDWRIIFLETGKNLKSKNIATLAAGSAFYASLAFFPLIAGLVAIVAHTLDINELQSALTSIEVYFPVDITAVVGPQLETAYQYNFRNIIIAVVSLIIALFASSRAMFILVNATNIAYEQKEMRNSWQLLGITCLMSVGAIVVISLVIFLILIDEVTLASFGVPSFLTISLPVLRWVLLASLIAGSLAVFYRFAISNWSPHWKWVSWGAGIASLIWLAGTTLFFLYVKNLAVFGTLYNVFGSVIVLLIWLNLSAYVILLGAVINQRLEQRTTRRTGS